MPTMLAIDYLAFWVAWVVGAWLVGVTAGKRGYSPVIWGVVSLFVSPVVGMVLLALITPGVDRGRDLRHSEPGAPGEANRRPNRSPLIAQRALSCSMSGGDERIRTGE